LQLPPVPPGRIWIYNTHIYNQLLTLFPGARDGILFADIRRMMDELMKLYRNITSYLVLLLALLVHAPITANAVTPYEERQTEPVSREGVLLLESILIEGNRRTPDAVILDYIAVAPGEAVDVGLIEDARDRLEATGYFRTVDLSSRPGSERGTVVVIVSVEEKSQLSLETGFGYDDLNGWFLTLLGMRLDNTIGAESQFRLGLRLGFRIAGIDAQWEKPIPYQGGFGYGLRFHAHSQSHLFFGSGPEAPGNWDGGGWRSFQQDINRVGIEGLIRHSLGGRTRISFGLQAESIEPDSTFKDREDNKSFETADLPSVLRGQLNKTVKTGFLFRVLRDTRDHGYYPRSGSFTLVTFEANNSFLGGDEIFTKSMLDIRSHIPVAGQTVFSSRVKAGFLSRGAPYYERFYLGGNYSVRGFEEWSLSPTEGDDGFWLINAELRAPLIPSRQQVPRLTGLIFLDAGQGWQRGESLSSHDIESAVGYGVRLRLPWLGTLGIDAGIPFSRGRTDENFRVHGLLGFSF
jgi:outer membrane protein insertion porin family